MKYDKPYDKPYDMSLGLLMAMALTKDKALGIPKFYDNFLYSGFIPTTHKDELILTLKSMEIEYIRITSKEEIKYMGSIPTLDEMYGYGLYSPKKEEYYVELCMNTLSQEDVDKNLNIRTKPKKQLYEVQIHTTLIVAAESEKDAQEWVEQQCQLAGEKDSIFSDPDSICVNKEIKSKKDIPQTLSITGEKWQIHSIPYNGDNYQPDYNETDYKYPIEYKIEDYLD